jgi:hypothetical protein
MIARFRFLLDTHVPLRSDQAFTPLEQPDPPGGTARIFGPYRATGYPIGPFTEISMQGIAAALSPENPMMLSGDIAVGGHPLIMANALQIDLIRSGFDRMRLNAEQGDSLRAHAIDLADGLLRRLRAVSGVSWIRSAADLIVATHLEFMNDDGARLVSDPLLYGQQMVPTLGLRLFIVSEETWKAVGQLPHDYQLPRWDALLLDAENALPHAGTTIVLAASAIETAIDEVIRHKVATRDDRTLWDWVLDRGDYRKDPSLEEKLDVVLAALSGSSLKSMSALWKGFKELKQLRNSYVHEGKLMSGNRPIDMPAVLRLLQGARDIIAWLEAFMPETERRQRLLSTQESAPGAQLSAKAQFRRGAP